MATRKKKNNIGAFGHPIYGKGFAKYGEMRPNGSSEIPNDLEEAAKEYAKTSFTRPYSDTPEEVIIIIEPDKFAGFIAGAKWMAEQLKK